MRIEAPFDENSMRTFRLNRERIHDDIIVLEVGYNQTPKGLKQIMNRSVYILHYIVSGKGKFMNTPFDDTSAYIVAPKELEIVESDEEEPYEAYWIMFSGTLAPSLLNKARIPEHNAVFNCPNNKECAKIIKKALLGISPQNNIEEQCLMQSAFYDIMASHLKDLAQEEPTASEIAKNVKKFLQENYNQQIKISDVSKLYNFSRNYMYTIFKKEYGMSPQEYLVNLRIEKAKELLLDKNEKFSVTEVAFATGFNDPLYFSKAFRKKMGVSPSDFCK